MFTYAEAEALLAELHGVDEHIQRGAFRGRLKHLKKLGIPLNSSPGRGKKIEYDRETLFQWSFCLEMQELGIDPAIIANLVAESWAGPHGINQFYKVAVRRLGERRIYCYFRPEFMTATWGSGSRPIPKVGWFAEADVGDVLDWMTSRPQRMCVFELSHVAAAVTAAETAGGK